MNRQALDSLAAALDMHRDDLKQAIRAEGIHELDEVRSKLVQSTMAATPGVRHVDTESVSYSVLEHPRSSLFA